MTTVRPARPADRLWLHNVQDTLTEPAPDLLDAALAGDALDVLVATADGDPVGYALLAPGPTQTYVAELAVAPAQRRAGHGTALLNAVEGSLRAVVRASDERARQFYEERGFQVEDRLADRFADGDGLLLIRDGK